MVPNIHSVPETPVFYPECLRKRVAYTRSPSTVPRVHSVHQEALSGTECYKEKDLACAKFLKLTEKRRPSLKSGWQLPLKGRSTSEQGEGAAEDKFRVSGMQKIVKGAGADKESGVLVRGSLFWYGAPLCLFT